MRKKIIRRIGVIGDVHAEHLYLKQALGFMESFEPDQLLCVGDIIDGREDVNQCVQLLIDYQVATVRGNHDRWFLQGQSLGLEDDTPRWTVTPQTNDTPGDGSESLWKDRDQRGHSATFGASHQNLFLLIHLQRQKQQFSI